ncbi:hypothetical protein BTR23_10150 [Alkalihalophilus pseudofirmus]|nr:hypothetical protein BTR23_10150 [Alkalihalophilus pseudofirmus]
MGKRILLMIFIMLLLPFYTVTASNISDYLPSNISIYDGEGTIEQISKEVNWKPLRTNHPNTDNFIWLKVDVPTDSHKDPYLYLNTAPAFLEVYQNQNLIYSYGEKESDPRIQNYRRWDLISIDENEPVFIQLKGNLPETVSIGAKHQFLEQMLYADLIRIIGNIGLIVMAFFSMIFYLFNRKQTLPLIFAGFALSLAIGGLLRLETKQILLDEALLFFYLNAFVSMIGPIFFFLFFSKLLDIRYKKVVAWSWKLYGAFCMFALIILTLWPKFLVAVMVGLNVLLMVSMLSISIFMVLSYVKTKRKVLLYSILGVTGFIMIYIIGIIGQISELRIEVGLIANYVLVTACISIFISQYVELNRKIQRYSVELEIKVEERTNELEETHQQFVKSIQESATAMAEIAALEERNRITQEIHDNVGHTLTATVLQIEASKRLMDKDLMLAKDKMDVAQTLVRKGIDDIRSSVRMLKANDWSFDLKTSLQELIQETCKYTDVHIDTELSAIPNLTHQQKSTLVLALKEGLTNGIKHGKCKRFHFRLSVEKDKVRFLLKNDGQPLELQKYGFGLSAMNERIQQLGGTLHVYPEKEWGCVLHISIPI